MADRNGYFTVSEPAPGYLRATIANPPINVFNMGMFDALEAFIDMLENRDDIKVVVFDSADPEFFIAHFDLLGDTSAITDKRPNGLYPWPDLTTRIAELPVLTIAAIRGRARGVGCEFAMSLDIRFASREKAVLQQLELALGLVPGGGAMERLPRLVGRSRALEVVLGAEEIRADRAELYGLVNRSIPDAEFEATVDTFARRVASFDRPVLALAKRTINEQAGLADPHDLGEGQTRFLATTQFAQTQQRVGQWAADGLQQRGELELSMGDYIAGQVRK
ncbi:enoyl-CoA hydratase/isomerase family protein [Streptomyces sp. NBC_01190]|uniref:enoyl-CoA hydratase/isomerase family protein n=1 Tax=Streptomyces sp. NBC_01190 TaxID=2903767 RepID=UPI003868D31E|nr:enoyl-CoA hydratase/isomerase family protein [Streptomyces sp. NBC_01190]